MPSSRGGTAAVASVIHRILPFACREIAVPEEVIKSVLPPRPRRARLTQHVGNMQGLSCTPLHDRGHGMMGSLWHATQRAATQPGDEQIIKGRVIGHQGIAFWSYGSWGHCRPGSGTQPIGKRARPQQATEDGRRRAPRRVTEILERAQLVGGHTDAHAGLGLQGCKHALLLPRVVYGVCVLTLL